VKAGDVLTISIPYNQVGYTQSPVQGGDQVNVDWLFVEYKLSRRVNVCPLIPSPGAGFSYFAPDSYLSFSGLPGSGDTPTPTPGGNVG
jgi:hypothetical protein